MTGKEKAFARVGQERNVREFADTRAGEPAQRRLDNCDPGRHPCQVRAAFALTGQA